MILKRKTMLQKNKTKKPRLLWPLVYFIFWNISPPIYSDSLTSLFGTYFNLTFHYKTNFYQVP